MRGKTIFGLSCKNLKLTDNIKQRNQNSLEANIVWWYSGLTPFLTPIFVIWKKKLLELYPSLNLNAILHLFSNLLPSMISLKYRYSLLFIRGHTDSYLLVLMNISNRPLLFIPVLHTMQSPDGNLSVASPNTTQCGLSSLNFIGSRL